MATTLLEVRNLKKYYPVRNGLFSHSKLHAVDDVSFCLKCNETMGLVGESGCGKTTLGKCVLRLEEPTEGEVVLAGQNVTSASSDRLRQIRRSMQMVFQDPTGSLNPRMRVGRVVEEPLLVHRICGKSEVRQKTVELFRLVGLKEEHMGRYPHQLSGGQQQRVGIARALVISPRLVILDEPTSGLDPIGCNHVKEMMLTLAKRGKTILLSSHLLADVEDVCDQIAILYNGRIRAYGSVKGLLEKRDIVSLSMPSLSPEMTKKLLNMIRKETGTTPRLEHPSMDLEQFFIQVVEEAHRTSPQRAGVSHTEGFAGYLKSGEPKSTDTGG